MRAALSLFNEALTMNNAPCGAWRTRLLSQTDQLIATAMLALDDANEAHILVHGVMMDAIVARPQSGRDDLDAALRRALRAHADG